MINLEKLLCGFYNKLTFYYFSATMNDSKMFEIDPKLFITCRLCLENTGAYRIMPAVQKQIKFCYEIEV